MMQRLVIGYIGNGKSTNRYHLPFLLTRQDKIDVKMIYARDLTKVVWPRYADIYYTQNLEQLLDDEDISVVVITTPVESHYALAKQVLGAGKHCVLEKPFTQTLAEAQELFALAKERQLLLQCYQNRRFDSDYLTAQAVIASGKLGDLIEVEMHFDYYRPEVPESTHQFSRANSYLYGHASHTIDQALAYFGVPSRVHYDVRQLLGSGRLNDYFDLDFYYEQLKLSIKSSYFRVHERPSFVVYGKRGMFIKESKDRQEEHLKLGYLPTNADFGRDRPADYGTLRYYDAQGEYHQESVISCQGDYGRYYDALYASIMLGNEPLVSAQQTLCQMQILEDGIQSLEQQ
jgi:predicted dehydrogenase